MFDQGIVGPQNIGSGVATSRFGQQGDKIVSQLHGKYYEQTARGNMFYAAIQAVSTTTVGLSTTYTGLCISNPVTSRVNAVLNKVSVMQSVLQGTQVEAYAIATGFNNTTGVTHTAALAVKNCLVGGNPGVVVADTSATLPTAPFYTLFVHNTATATADGTGAVVDLEGSIVLPPGGYAAWVSPAQASVAGLWFSFFWEEVPIL